MGKVIKKGSAELGDITPETGFAETGVRRAPIIERDTFEARSEGQQIRERALAEAEEIRQQALEEAEQIRRDAYEDGLKQGRDEGASELVETVARAGRRLQQIEDQAEPQLKELAVKIARKILGKELELAPESIVAMVKQALSDKARQRREIFLRVHPDDLQFIRENKPELLEVLSRAKEIGVREDPDVARHGVIIETDAGIIDAQLETQLGAFEKVLKEVR